MPTTAVEFDGKIEKWKQEMEMPWAKLKYKLTQSNLARHLTQNRMRILDAGGGNGIDSLPLARQGHFVEIYDYSQAMLADAKQQAIQENLQEQIKTHHADIKDIANIFPASHFDLILCHNVLQYAEDVSKLIRDLSAFLKPNGVVSIISTNRYSTPYHAAFLDNNLAEALAQLETRTSKAKIFDAEIIGYSAAEIRELLENNNIKPEADYGIRCMCDYWGDNERKLDPSIFEQIEHLEYALTARHPYKLLARYFQVIGRKAKDI